MSDILKALLDTLTEDQKRDLIQSLTDTVTEKSVETTEETVSSKNRGNVHEDFTVHRESTNNRKTPVKFKKNKWVDTGELSEVETPNFEKTPRKRGQPNKKQVECHVCGKKFAIHSSLVYGEYQRCNKCTGK
jgi:hypothetical protein